jgi:hypothetical protein
VAFGSGSQGLPSTRRRSSSPYCTGPPESIRRRW